MGEATMMNSSPWTLHVLPTPTSCCTTPPIEADDLTLRSIGAERRFLILGDCRGTGRPRLLRIFGFEFTELVRIDDLTSIETV